MKEQVLTASNKVETMTNTHFYKSLLVAPSGSGKTMSARNLDRNTTGFINVENKPLPFKGAFKNYSIPKDISETAKALIDMGKNPEINCIFLDSLSAIFDMVLADARSKFKGFDIWNYYNDTIQKFINLIKKTEKEMFITAHYEVLNVEGSPEKRVKVKGKELEGVIEKDFTIVLYGNKKFDEKGKPTYHFDLVVDGASAKCPPDIFGEDVYQITNDCKVILEGINTFKQ
jgi:hypothetical protein